jgi:predicted dehydrogenase
LIGLAPTVWMGFNRRFERDAETVRARVASDPPAALELEMSILPRSWDALGGSETVLLDLGPHLVDLALWLTGRDARRIRVERATDGEASFELDLGDVLAAVRVSHRSAWHERVAVHGGGGRAVTLLERGGLARRLASRVRPGGSEPLVESLAAQLSAVARAVRGDDVDARLADAAAGVAVLRVLDAAATAPPGEWVAL